MDTLPPHSHSPPGGHAAPRHSLNVPVQPDWASSTLGWTFCPSVQYSPHTTVDILYNTTNGAATTGVDTSHPDRQCFFLRNVLSMANTIRHASHCPTLSTVLLLFYQQALYPYTRYSQEHLRCTCLLNRSFMLTYYLTDISDVTGDDSQRLTYSSPNSTLVVALLVGKESSLGYYSCLISIHCAYPPNDPLKVRQPEAALFMNRS